MLEVKPSYPGGTSSLFAGSILGNVSDQELETIPHRFLFQAELRGCAKLNDDSTGKL